MGYKNDSTWKKTQSFLPITNRLTEDTMPEELFIDLDEGSIHIDHYKQQNPKATLILFHGVGGNGRLLSFIAVPLWKKGYEVICPDMPLYGYTTYKGQVSYHMWVDCGVKIAQHYQKAHTPVFLFGLSAGGMLAYQIACRCDDIKGVIATCLLDQRDPLVTKETASNHLVATVGRKLLAISAKILPNLKIPMKSVCNMQAIVNNQQLADLLMQDQRSSGTKVSLLFLHTMLHPQISIVPDQFTKCPFLLVHPEEDRWTHVSLSKRFFDQLACKKALKMLEGAGHFPIEPIGLKQMEQYCIDFIENQQ